MYVVTASKMFSMYVVVLFTYIEMQVHYVQL